MATTPTPITLAQAITAVEASQTALSNADGNLSAANDKLTSAQQAQVAAQTADTAAVSQANSDLDTLIAIATVAKR